MGAAARTLKHWTKQASMVADQVFPPPAGVTILLYHRVEGGSDSDVDLPLAAFEQQLEHLAEHHDVISLDDALARLQPGDDDGPDEPAVVITIDDGTADLTDHLLPALDRAGLPATAYIATRFVDEGLDFPWGAPPTSWAALRDARSPLVTYGSHTHDHFLLDRLSPDLVRADLDRSIDLLASHLGTEPRHFAYPKAVAGSPAAEIEVRHRFDSAALARSRVNVRGSTDPFRLWRTPVQRSDGADHFAGKAAGGHRFEGTLREWTARRRYRSATQ